MQVKAPVVAAMTAQDCVKRVWEDACVQYNNMQGMISTLSIIYGVAHTPLYYLPY